MTENKSKAEIELDLLKEEIDSLEKIEEYYYDDLILIFNERRDIDDSEELEGRRIKLGEKMDSLELLLSKKRREQTNLFIKIKRQNNK